MSAEVDLRDPGRRDPVGEDAAPPGAGLAGGHARITRVRSEGDLEAVPWDSSRAICVLLALSGSCRVQLRNGIVELVGEHFMLSPRGVRPRLQGIERARLVALSFADTSVSLSADRLSGMSGTPIRAESGVRAVFLSLLRSLVDDGTARSGQVDLYVNDALLALFTAALLDAQSEGSVGESQPETLLLAVRRTIEERLHDPELRLGELAEAHHVSVSSLQKLFAAQGYSVTGWIRERRLEHCRRDIADPAQRAVPLAVIAARRGFTSAAHFSRVFTKNFGMTPREYRVVSQRQPRPHGSSEGRG